MNPIVSRASGIPAAVYALSAGSFGIGTTEFVIMGLLMNIAHDFNISISLAAYSITAYAFGVVIGAPLLTPMLIKYKKKPALIFLMCIFSIGNLWCGFSGSITSLIIARVITAFAHASFFGISSVYASELSPPKKRASAVSVVFLGATLANITGVPLGAWIGQLFGWRYSFFMVAIIGMVSSIAIMIFVPNVKNKKNNDVKLKDELKVITYPNVLKSLLITAFGFSGVFSVFTYIEVMLRKITGLNDRLIPPVFILFGIGMVFGNHVGGRLADKETKKALLISLSFLVFVLCLFPIAILTIPTACVVVFLLGMAMFSTIPPLQVQALDSSEISKSMISSCNIAAFNLGNAAGAWVGGVLITSGVTLSNIPFAGAVLTAIGLCIAFMTL